MSSFKPRLRRVVEKPLIRFALAKVPLTLCSVLFFKCLRLSGVEIFYAASLNSMVTQCVEFVVQKRVVFREPHYDSKNLTKQALLFFSGVIVIALVEGAVLNEIQTRLGLGDILSYALGHIPTFFIRYAWDRQYVFNHQPSPSSS